MRRLRAQGSTLKELISLQRLRLMQSCAFTCRSVARLKQMTGNFRAIQETIAHTASPGSTIQLVDLDFNTNIYVPPPTKRELMLGAMLQLLSVLQCVCGNVFRGGVCGFHRDASCLFGWALATSPPPPPALSKSLYYCMRNSLEMKSLFTFSKKAKKIVPFASNQP